MTPSEFAARVVAEAEAKVTHDMTEFVRVAHAYKIDPDTFLRLVGAKPVQPTPTLEARLTRVEAIAENAFKFVGNMMEREAKETQERIATLRLEINQRRSELRTSRVRPKKPKPIKRRTVKRK